MARLLLMIRPTAFPWPHCTAGREGFRARWPVAWLAAPGACRAPADAIEQLSAASGQESPPRQREVTGCAFRRPHGGERAGLARLTARSPGLRARSPEGSRLETLSAGRSCPRVQTWPLPADKIWIASAR